MCHGPHPLRGCMRPLSFVRQKNITQMAKAQGLVPWCRAGRGCACRGRVPEVCW